MIVKKKVPGNLCSRVTTQPKLPDSRVLGRILDGPNLRSTKERDEMIESLINSVVGSGTKASNEEIFEGIELFKMKDGGKFHKTKFRLGNHKRCSDYTILSAMSSRMQSTAKSANGKSQIVDLELDLLKSAVKVDLMLQDYCVENVVMLDGEPEQENQAPASEDDDQGFNMKAYPLVEFVNENGAFRCKHCTFRRFINLSSKDLRSLTVHLFKAHKMRKN